MEHSLSSILDDPASDNLNGKRHNGLNKATGSDNGWQLDDQSLPSLVSHETVEDNAMPQEEQDQQDLLTSPRSGSTVSAHSGTNMNLRMSVIAEEELGKSHTQHIMPVQGSATTSTTTTTDKHSPKEKDALQKKIQRQLEASSNTINSTSSAASCQSKSKNTQRRSMNASSSSTDTSTSANTKTNTSKKSSRPSVSPPAYLQEDGPPSIDEQAQQMRKKRSQKSSRRASNQGSTTSIRSKSPSASGSGSGERDRDRDRERHSSPRRKPSSRRSSQSGETNTTSSSTNNSNSTSPRSRPKRTRCNKKPLSKHASSSANKTDEEEEEEPVQQVAWIRSPSTRQLSIVPPNEKDAPKEVSPTIPETETEEQLQGASSPEKDATVTPKRQRPRRTKSGMASFPQDQTQQPEKEQGQESEQDQAKGLQDVSPRRQSPRRTKSGELPPAKKHPLRSQSTVGISPSGSTTDQALTQEMVWSRSSTEQLPEASSPRQQSPRRMKSTDEGATEEVLLKDSSSSGQQRSTTMETQDASPARQRPRRARPGIAPSQAQVKSRSPNRQSRLERSSDGMDRSNNNGGGDNIRQTKTNGNSKSNTMDHSGKNASGGARRASMDHSANNPTGKRSNRRASMDRSGNIINSSRRRHEQRGENSKQPIRRAKSLDESNSSLLYESGDDGVLTSESKAGDGGNKMAEEGEESISFLDVSIPDDDNKKQHDDTADSNQNTRNAKSVAHLGASLSIEYQHPAGRVRRGRQRRPQGRLRNGAASMSASCSVIDYDEYGRRDVPEGSAFAVGSPNDDPMAVDFHDDEQQPNDDEGEEDDDDIDDEEELDQKVDETQKKKKRGVLSALKKKVLGKRKKDKSKTKSAEGDESGGCTAPTKGDNEAPAAESTVTEEDTHNPEFSDGNTTGEDVAAEDDQRPRQRRPRGKSVEGVRRRRPRGGSVEPGQKLTPVSDTSPANVTDDDEMGSRHRATAAAAAAAARSRRVKSRSGQNDASTDDIDAEDPQSQPRQGKRMEAAGAAAARARARRERKAGEPKQSLRTNSQAAAVEAAARARMRSRKKETGDEMDAKADDEKKRVQRHRKNGAMMAAAATAKAKAAMRDTVRTISSDAADAAVRRKRRTRKPRESASFDSSVDDPDEDMDGTEPGAIRRE